MLRRPILHTALACLLSSTVLLAASSLSILLPSPDPTELFCIVNHPSIDALEPASATIPMDSALSTSNLFWIVSLRPLFLSSSTICLLPLNFTIETGLQVEKVVSVNSINWILELLLWTSFPSAVVYVGIWIEIHFCVHHHSRWDPANDASPPERNRFCGLIKWWLAGSRLAPFRAQIFCSRQ